MFARERQENIAKLILEKESVSVVELSELYDISEVTIRKDLEELQRQGRVIRTHGGAVSLYKPSAAFSFQDLSVKCIEEKQQIARTAIDLIADGDSIILDGSTTVQELAKLIVGSGKKDLTIITTSINTAGFFFDKKEGFFFLVGGGGKF